MGKFEVSRFVTVPDPDLICCVCYCVLDDPLESPCQHVFCNVCISTWLNNRKNCPNCRARLRPSRLKPVLPIVRNMINRLQIRCENIGSGCTSVVQLENYKSHVDTCDFATVLCKNEDCDKGFLRKDLNEHEIECRYRLTKCEKGCDLLFPVSKLTGHNCLSELKVKLQKAEDNLEAVTLKVTDIEKRLQTLERNERARPSRSPEFGFNGRSSPPLPWYSPSGPNRRDNERSRHRTGNQTQADNGSRRRRGRSSRYSSSYGRRRRRSVNLLSSRSRSRSPMNVNLLVSDTSSLSVTSDNTEDSEFAHETSLSPAENSERRSFMDDPDNNNTSGTEAPEDNTSSAAVVTSDQPEESGNNESSAMNISSTSLSPHSDNQERDSTVRRSPRIAASRGPSNNSRTSDAADNGNQQEAPYSSVPVLSRSTIEELMNASSDTSDDSFHDPLPRFSMSSSSDIEIEDDSGGLLSDVSTNSRTRNHWTSLLNGLIYESSDTDDTWSWRNRSNRSQTSDSEHEEQS